MRVTLERTRCIVEREPGDHKIRATGYASAESAFLFQVKRALNAQGNDFIKKRMWKDGHLMGDDALQYLRTRSPQSNGEQAYIYLSRWQIEDAAEVYNREGKYTLAVERDIWKATA